MSLDKVLFYIAAALAGILVIGGLIEIINKDYSEARLTLEAMLVPVTWMFLMKYFMASRRRQFKEWLAMLSELSYDEAISIARSKSTIVPYEVIIIAHPSTVERGMFFERDSIRFSIERSKFDRTIVREL